VLGNGGTGFGWLRVTSLGAGDENRTRTVSLGS
jgi:hypothetical protein